MPLHGCPYSFEELAVQVFPEFYSSLEKSLRSPLRLCPGKEMHALIPAKPGCYVFIQDGLPIYVGIAKNMRRRVLDHLSGNPAKANLAVRMAAKALGVGLRMIKSQENFGIALEVATARLHEAEVAWLEIQNPLEMYLFEPYCAMKLDTVEFNFFDTLQILSPRRLKT